MPRSIRSVGAALAIAVAWLVAPVSPAAGQAGPPTTRPNPALNRFLHPQRLVTVAPGRRIHLYCLGRRPDRRTPIVLFLAGLGAFSSTWTPVQEAIARRTRTCAFDRAGLGHSDPSPEPQDAPHIIADFERTLAAAGEAGPYLVVAHSAGAYEALLFADAHRADLAGMVLVDPSVPNQDDEFRAAAPTLAADGDENGRSERATLRECAAEIRAHRLDTRTPAADRCFFYFAYFPEYPDRIKAMLRRLDADPARLETRASLNESFPASGRLAIDPRRDYGDLPLIVLTAEGQALPPDLPAEIVAEVGRFRSFWQSGHDRLAALSRRGVNRVVPHAGHEIQVQQPAAVIAAIVEALDGGGIR